MTDLDAYLHDPDPGHLARYDQAHAAVSGELDTLIRLHAGVLADNTARREIHVVGMGAWILANSTHEAAAELLAVAIDRLTTDEHVAQAPLTSTDGV